MATNGIRSLSLFVFRFQFSVRTKKALPLTKSSNAKYKLFIYY